MKRLITFLIILAIFGSLLPPAALAQTKEPAGITITGKVVKINAEANSFILEDEGAQLWEITVAPGTDFEFRSLAIGDILTLLVANVSDSKARINKTQLIKSEKKK